jgi:hypothetical protein
MPKVPKTASPGKPRFTALDGEPVSPELLVQDANTLKEFLANAKAVWLEHSVDQVRGQGRPSVRGKVIQALWRERPNGCLGPSDTHGRLIGLVQGRLGSEAPRKDAIRKYVKMWTILQKNKLIAPSLSLPSADLQWFNKHASKTMRLLRDYSQEIRKLNREQLDQVIATRRLDPSYCHPRLLQLYPQLTEELEDFHPPSDISRRR